MVDTRLMLIHLPKPSQLVLEPFVTEAIGCLVLKILFKGKLRARQQANSNIWVANRSETSRDRVEEGFCFEVCFAWRIVNSFHTPADARQVGRFSERRLYLLYQSEKPPQENFIRTRPIKFSEFSYETGHF